MAQATVASSSTTPEPQDRQDRAALATTVGLVFGILGLATWWLPGGWLVPGLGIVFSSRGLRSARRKQAIAGLVLCVIGSLLGLGYTLKLFWGNLPA